MHLNPTNHLGTYLDKYRVVPYFFRSWFLAFVGLLIKYIKQVLFKREFVKCCLDWLADCSRTPSRRYRLINKTSNSRRTDLPTRLLIIYLIKLPKFHNVLDILLAGIYYSLFTSGQQVILKPIIHLRLLRVGFQWWLASRPSINGSLDWIPVEALGFWTAFQLQ